MHGKQLSVAALLVVLTGCSTVSPPPPQTDRQAEVLYAAMLDRSWISTGLSERMPRPEIAAESPLSVETWPQAIVECMAEEGFSQVEFHWEPLRGYYLDRVRDIESSVLDNAEVRFFVCVSRHPIDVRDEELLLTRAQLDYLYDYYQRSVVPCLRVNGVELSSVQSREEFAAGQGSWSPYHELTPELRTSPDYERLVQLCGTERPSLG